MSTWVFTSKAAYMQRIQDYVRTGHHLFIQGVIPPAKVVPFAEKMHSRHPVFDNKLKAFRAREKGEATGRLMFWMPHSDSDKVHWILLVHPAKADTKDPKKGLDQSEQWKSALHRDEKVELTGYELVRLTKPSYPARGPATQGPLVPAKPKASKPTWTWRYLADRYQDIRDELVLAIRSKRDQDVKCSIDVIWGTMGFAGCRTQAKALEKVFKDEWKLRRPREKAPETKPGHGYLRRKADVGFFMDAEKEKKVPVVPARRKVKAASGPNAQTRAAMGEADEIARAHSARFNE